MRDKKALSTLLCGLLVFTGSFCLCNPVSAATDILPLNAYPDAHQAHHADSAASSSDCGEDQCRDCAPNALGQTSPQELKASHSIKLEPNTPDVDLISMALGPEPPSVIALANPQTLPRPRRADTPIRRWDLLLE
jgi:hypothetical protein